MNKAKTKKSPLKTKMLLLVFLDYEQLNFFSFF